MRGNEEEDHGRFERDPYSEGRGAGVRSLLLVGALLVAVGIAFKVASGPRKVSEEPRRSPKPTRYKVAGEDTELVERTRNVLASGERIWRSLYPQLAAGYEEVAPRYSDPRLVLFSDALRQACGGKEVGSGALYCHGNGSLCLDLAFLRPLLALEDRESEGVLAYVVGNQLARHVQNLLGIEAPPSVSRRGVGSTEQQRRLALRRELHADYLTGVWLHWVRAEARQAIEQGGRAREGVAEPLGSGSSNIGLRYETEEGFGVLRDAVEYCRDWAEQAESGTRYTPWDLGTVDQRLRWLERGRASGDPGAHSPFEVHYGDL